MKIIKKRNFSSLIKILPKLPVVFCIATFCLLCANCDLLNAGSTVEAELLGKWQAVGIVSNGSLLQFPIDYTNGPSNVRAVGFKIDSNSVTHYTDGNEFLNFNNLYTEERYNYEDIFDFYEKDTNRIQLYMRATDHIAVLYYSASHYYHLRKVKKFSWELF